MPTSYNSVEHTEIQTVAEENSDFGDTQPCRLFVDRREARLAGLRSKWEWRRNYRQVVKGANAEALLHVLGENATQEELDFFGNWHGSLKAVHEGRKINRTVNLYRADQTRPYRPTKHTEALWVFEDIFVRNRECYAQKVNLDTWVRVQADGDVRLLLTDTKLGNHCLGKETFCVFAGDTTEFLVVQVKSVKQAEALVLRCGEIKDQLSSRKLFFQWSQDDFEMWVLLNGPRKVVPARRQLEAMLRHVGILGEVFPQTNKPIGLPLASWKTTLTDQVDLTGDVVALVEWMKNGEDADPAEALDGFRLEMAETQVSKIVVPIDQQLVEFTGKEEKGRDGLLPMGLLSIPYQNQEPITNSPLKNRCWQQVTSFWRGEPTNLDLDRALIISARLLAFEGVPDEEAEGLLLAYAHGIPDPTSSRLIEPGKRSLLLKDIKKSIKRAYEDNSRQEDPTKSTNILRNVARVWQAKGLKLSDKSTWGNVNSYLAIQPQEIEFTEDELDALQCRLRGVLSKRDLQGLNYSEAVTGLARAVVRLVAGKESETLAICYWSKYLKAEAGMNFGNRNKLVKVRNVFIDLGLIKVLKKGSEGAGATRYGLGATMAERLGRPVLRSVEGFLPDNWEEIVASTITPLDEQVEAIQEEAVKGNEAVLPIVRPTKPWEASLKEARRQHDLKEEREWLQYLKSEGFG